MKSANSNVIDYYHSTDKDYKLFWSGKTDRAIHFGFYDGVIKKHSDALIRMNAELARHARIDPKDTVLDAGCGYGGSSFWLAENLKCKVTGINIVENQIRLANQEAIKRNLTARLGFELTDFSKTYFKNQTFDVIWALESVVHSPNNRLFLNESYRLLKPSGRLIMTEYTLTEKVGTSPKKETVINFFSGWAISDLITETQYKERLLSAGFRNIKTLNISKEVSPSVNHLGKTRLPTFPVAYFYYWILKLLSFIGLFSKTKLKNIE
jgi:cyclopropane fatty-acyl-phospholipid synthase-like methyltransferase